MTGRGKRPRACALKANGTPMDSVHNLYLNDSMADVSFVFESENVRLPAHKLILAAASDVFKTMFYGDLPEKRDVKIVDATSEVFKLFLQFFYWSKVELPNGNVAEVMALGHKYNVPECTQICIDLLEETLDVENVFRCLGLAILYDLDGLKQHCETMIANRTTAVLKSQSFLEISRAILGNILEMEYMDCREKDLFEACMAWVKHASKQKYLTKEIVEAHLGPLFYNIRFGLMTINEFGPLSLAYGSVFSPDEYKEIVHMISVPGFKPTLFNKDSQRKDMRQAVNRNVQYYPDEFPSDEESY